jgi:AraC-like DNA-binding protein
METAMILMAGAAAGIAFLSCAVLASQSAKSAQARIMLAALIACAAFNTVHPAIFAPLRAPARALPLEPLQYLIAPMAAGYLLVLLRGRLAVTFRLTPHILPALGATLITVLEPAIGAGHEWIIIALWIGLIVQLSAYFIPMSRLMHAYQRSLREKVSNTTNASLAWFPGFYLIILTVGLLYLLVPVLALHTVDGTILRFGLSLAMLTVTCILALRGISQVEPPVLETTAMKNPLSPEAARKVASDLKELMDRHRPFLQPELSLGELADMLDLPRNLVSYCINNALGKSFYEFVNEYRVREFTRLARDPGRKNDKILTLAFDAGFNSKPTFNKVVLQLTGKTPTQIRQQA